MKSKIFSLFVLLFLTEIHRVNALQCYTCTSTIGNTTGCNDKFNPNGTLISIGTVNNTDAICTKMFGKLNNGVKFTFRNATPNGCPKGLESSVIVGNATNVQISSLQIHCCNKNLCNQAISQYYIQPNMLILIVFIVNLLYFFHVSSNK